MTRVLIVEDEAVLRLTFSQFLEEEGYEPVAVETYAAALSVLDEEDFDVVVTDIVLPGKTGVDLLHAVRERELGIPVIIITGEPTVETASEAVRLGAFDYLAKPVTGKDLKRVVRLGAHHKVLSDERDAYARGVNELRRELETVFQSLTEGIITVDENMRVHQVNHAAEEMLGVTQQEMAERPFNAVTIEHLSRVGEALEETIRTGDVFTDQRVELTLGPRNHKVITFNTAPLIDSDSRRTGAVLTLRDLTRLTQLESQLQDASQYRHMVGRSPKMREVFALVRSVADTDSTVLLWGESGTGKELVAEALHQESARAKGAFIKVNCVALSEDILESELFGHVKGAFTGAVRDRVGRFEAAAGGTIFLDEIGDISPRLQLRLLRVLQEREFERVGDTTPIHVDVRIVAASNQNLYEKIRQGVFREDLYYRLNVVRIELPPLRERRDDIVALAEHFCRRFNQKFNKEITGFAPETLERLYVYDWPGNIRELENSIERAFVVCSEDVILPKHLPSEISAGAPSSTKISSALDTKDLERKRIVDVLERTDWNVAKSARTLGIARNTLYQKMRSFDIQRPSN